jgi:hypothetical protein
MPNAVCHRMSHMYAGVCSTWIFLRQSPKAWLAFLEPWGRGQYYSGSVEKGSRTQPPAFVEQVCSAGPQIYNLGATVPILLEAGTLRAVVRVGDTW